MFLFLDVIPNKLVFQPSCLSNREFSVLDLRRMTDCELVTAIITRDNHHEHDIQLLLSGMAYTFGSAGCSYHFGVLEGRSSVWVAARLLKTGCESPYA